MYTFKFALLCFKFNLQPKFYPEYYKGSAVYGSLGLRGHFYIRGQFCCGVGPGEGQRGSQSVSGVRQRFLPTWDCGPANNRSLNKPVPGLSTFDRNQSVSAVIWHEMNISPVIWSLCHLAIA